MNLVFNTKQKCEYELHFSALSNLIHLIRRPSIESLMMNDLISSYCNNVDSNSSAKLAYFLTRELELRFSLNCSVSSSRKITLPVFNEIPMSFVLHKNCIMNDLLQDVMEKVVEAGIPQHFWKVEQEVKYNIGLDSGEIEDNRRILSLNDLEFGFVIFIIALSVSTVVFFCEFLGPKIKKFVRLLIGLFYFLRLLRVRLGNFYC
jgi:hypothetical protein